MLGGARASRPSWAPGSFLPLSSTSPGPETPRRSLETEGEREGSWVTALPLLATSPGSDGGCSEGKVGGVTGHQAPGYCSVVLRGPQRLAACHSLGVSPLQDTGGQVLPTQGRAAAGIQGHSAAGRAVCRGKARVCPSCEQPGWEGAVGQNSEAQTYSPALPLICWEWATGQIPSRTGTGGGRSAGGGMSSTQIDSF